jgi:hypothetical protein
VLELVNATAINASAAIAAMRREFRVGVFESFRVTSEGDVIISSLN